MRRPIDDLREKSTEELQALLSQYIDESAKYHVRGKIINFKTLTISTHMRLIKQVLKEREEIPVKNEALQQRVITDMTPEEMKGKDKYYKFGLV